MRSRYFTLVLACLAGIGCTRGITSPDDLAEMSIPRVMRLTITPIGGGTAVVYNSLPVTTSGGVPGSGGAIGAFAEFTDGQARYVEAVWRSSDDTVAAVVDNALVARQPGTATLTATFDGQTDSENFVVDSGFFGRWSGTYVVEQCVANTGAMQDTLCRPAADGRAGIAPVGVTLPFAIEIADTSGEAITGRVSFGNIGGVLSGRNRGGGFFSLTGPVAAPGGAITVVEWNMRAVRGVMEGVFSYEVRLDGVAGAGAVAGRLSTMTRQ